MKTLFLVRHAKSSWKDHRLDDIDRPLNKRGQRDAPFMAHLMKKKGVNIDVFVSSPALRAHSTAIAFAKVLADSKVEIILKPEIYEVSSATLIYTVQNQFKDEWDAVMMFGHNYAYTDFANWYAKPFIENVPTCGIVAIDFEVENWSDVTRSNGIVRFFEFPRKYFPK
ncbi:MAG: histidine phosphatase family protein [Saprospiraceae bacterium]|nr:histidine phosphatase family protein [Saprospiraceae bacterium]